MSCTVHIRRVDDPFSEWTVQTLSEARRAIETAAAELGPRFSHGQAWETGPLGLRVGFDVNEGWSDAHPAVFAAAPAVDL